MARRSQYDSDMMPVAPEKLLMTFSLAEVTQMVIDWEDAQNAAEEQETAVVSQDAETVRPVRAA